MKKTMKKMTAFILTVLLIIPLISVQGFALFDKITEVVINEKEILTARYIEDYIELLKEYEELTDDDYFYYVSVKADVTISTGEVITSNDFGIGESQNKKRSYYIDSYIDIRDYQLALEQGKNTIPLYYEVTLLSSIDIELDKFEGKTEISFVDCIIKELIPVSGLPEKYVDRGIIGSIVDSQLNTDKNQYLLEGAVFDIVLPDGTVKREAVKKAVREEYTYEELDGEEIDYWVDEEESVLEIYYKDAILTVPIEIVPYPVSAVKIDDVKVSDSFEAQTVTYTVTKADGTTQAFTVDISGEPILDIIGMQGYAGEFIDEAPVVILVTKYNADEYPPREYIEVTVISDISIMDSVEIQGPEQEGTALGALIYKIISFIKRIFTKFLPVML